MHTILPVALICLFLCPVCSFVPTTVKLPTVSSRVAKVGFVGAVVRAQNCRRNIALNAVSAAGPAAPDTAMLSHPLAAMLSECKGFGLVRFISVNPSGSVLETAARMDLEMKGFTVPGKGQYITIASEDKLFECHINLDLVRTATMTQEPAKIGGHMLHVLRLKDAKGTNMLSCMLQYDPSKGPGCYFPGAVEAFEAVLRKRGPEVQFPPREA